MSEAEKQTQPNTEAVKPQRERGQRPQRRGNKPVQDDGFDQHIINIRRVARTNKGGKSLRMSVFVVVGDREGRIGLGIGKGTDVASAQAKAVARAKRNMIMVPLKGNTVPHEIEMKFKSSRVVLRPAAPGTGIVAGATVKAILEIAGVKDILTKVLGSTNQINVSYATMEALKELKLARL